MGKHALIPLLNRGQVEDLLNKELDYTAYYEKFRRKIIDNTKVVIDEDLIQVEAITSADVAATNKTPNNSFESCILQPQTVERLNEFSQHDCFPSVCVSTEQLNHMAVLETLLPKVFKSFELHIKTTSNTPFSEFDQNDQLLLGAFPVVFLLGKGCLRKSGCTPGFKLYSSTQYDNRGSDDAKFQFIMFNQTQRHTAAQTIKSRIVGNSKTIKNFISLVNSEGIAEKIQHARDNPNLKSSVSLLRQIMPSVKLGGSLVPFGPIERSRTLSILHSYVAFFGLPSWFITIAPADCDSPLMIRMGSLHMDNNNRDGLGTVIDKFGKVKLSIPIPQSSEMRAIALSKNPAIAALVFEKMIRAVIKCLFCILNENDYKKTAPSYAKLSGVLGALSAMVTVFETQGRGSLHGHSAGWGSLVPKLLETVANNPRFVEVISRALDTMVTAHVPRSIHIFRQKVKYLGNNKRYALTMLCPRKFINSVGEKVFVSEEELQKSYSMELLCVPCSILNAPTSHDFLTSDDNVVQQSEKKKLDFCEAQKELESSADFKYLSKAHQRAYLAMVFSNYHECGDSCGKGKAGKFGCRFAKPSVTPVPKTRPVIIEYDITSVESVGNKKKIIVSHVEANVEISPCVTHLPILKETDFDNHNAKRLYVEQYMLQDPRFLMWELYRPLIDNSDENTSLSMQNGHITEFNDALAAVTSCNQAIYSLGSAEQAKNIIYYMLDYMVKNSTKIQNCFSLIAQAMTEAKRFPSKADDAGTMTRNAQYFLNKVVNKLTVATEVSASMAAASNLGLTSSLKSHDTWFVFNQPAVAALTNYCASISSEFNDDVQIADDTLDDFENINLEDNCQNVNNVEFTFDEANDKVGEEVEGSGYADDEFVKNLTEDIRHNFGGYNFDDSVFKDSDTGVYQAQLYKFDDKVIAVAQHEIYSNRGHELRNMCFLEWACIVKVLPYDYDKAVESGEMSKDAEIVEDDMWAYDIYNDENNNDMDVNDLENVGTSVGRNNNRKFFFDPSFVLHKNYCQRFRSKFCVPELCGRQAPRFPSSTSSNFDKEADGFARYAITLLVPWYSKNDQIEISSEILGTTATATTGNGLLGKYISLKPNYFDYRHFCEWAARVNPSYIHRNRIRYACNMSQLFAANYLKKQVCQTYRHKNARIWKEKRNAYLYDIDGDLNVAGPNSELSFSGGAELMIDVIRKMQDPNGHLCKQEEVLDQIMFMVEPLYNNITDEVLVQQEVVNNDYSNSGYFVSKNKAYDTFKNIEDDYKIFNDESQVDTDAEYKVPLSEKMFYPDNMCLTKTSIAIKDFPELNVQQNKAVQMVIQNVNDRMSDPSVTALNILIHGSPGTGKSYVANLIQKELRENGHHLLSCAPTGVAASCLDMGRTLHNMFMFSVNTSSGSRSGNEIKEFDTADTSHNLQKLTGSKLLLFRSRMNRCDGLILDEISFVSADMLYCIDQRLKQAMNNDRPFGGKIIIAMGDMFQLPPVGGKSLINSVLDFQKYLNTNISACSGATLFQSFIMIPLIEQKRLYDTEENRIHAAHIANMRQNIERPVTVAFLDSVKTLSKSDIDEDQTWLTAPIAVTNNSERARLNAVQVLRFAAMLNLPCLRWKKKRVGALKVSMNIDDLFFDR